MAKMQAVRLDPPQARLPQTKSTIRLIKIVAAYGWVAGKSPASGLVHLLNLCLNSITLPICMPLRTRFPVRGESSIRKDVRFSGQCQRMGTGNLQKTKRRKHEKHSNQSTQSMGNSRTSSTRRSRFSSGIRQSV